MSTAAAPRLAPLPRARWGDDVRAALEFAYSDEVAARLCSTAPDAMRVPNVLGALMHHPALAGPYLAYSNVLLHDPAIGHRRRELLVLRVAVRTRSHYEWAQHVRLAPRVGISPEEIEAVAEGPSAPRWSPIEALLLTAADELIDDYRINAATWERLAEHLDERQLVEVVFIVGNYTGLAMALNSFGVELDPELHEAASTPLPEPEE